MPLDDEIDGPSESKTKPATRRAIIKARHILYLQYVAVILSVLINQFWRWGYGTVMATGIIGLFFWPIVSLLGISMLCCPVLFFLLWKEETPREFEFWIMGPLSVLLSFVQFLALLPIGE